MMVAVRSFDYLGSIRQGARLKVVTKKYKNRTRTFCRQRHARRSDQALWLDGTGSAGGLADAIVDLVSTGGPCARII